MCHSEILCASWFVRVFLFCVCSRGWIGLCTTCPSQQFPCQDMYHSVLMASNIMEWFLPCTTHTGTCSSWGCESWWLFLQGCVS